MRVLIALCLFAMVMIPACTLAMDASEIGLITGHLRMGTSGGDKFGYTIGHELEEEHQEAEPGVEGDRYQDERGHAAHRGLGGPVRGRKRNRGRRGDGDPGRTALANKRGAYCGISKIASSTPPLTTTELVVMVASGSPSWSRSR